METAHLPQIKPDTYEAALKAACIGIWDYDMVKDEVTLAGFSYSLFEVPPGTVLKGLEWIDRIYPADRAHR